MDPSQFYANVCGERRRYTVKGDNDERVVYDVLFPDGKIAQNICVTRAHFDKMTGRNVNAAS